MLRSVVVPLSCPPPGQKTLTGHRHNRVLLQSHMDHADEKDRKQTLCGLKDLSVFPLPATPFFSLTFLLPADAPPVLSSLSYDVLSNRCNKITTGILTFPTRADPWRYLLSKDVRLVCPGFAFLHCGSHRSGLTGSQAASGYG